MAAVLLTGVATWLARAALTTLGLVAYVQVLKLVKYRGFDCDPSVTRPEATWLGSVALVAATVGTWMPGWARGLVAVAGAGAIAVVWLDTVLFRIFTIELGPGGVSDIVVSVMYRELAELTHARRFFARHRTILVLPFTAALGFACVALGAGAMPLRIAVVSHAVCVLACAAALGRLSAGRAMVPFVLFAAVCAAPVAALTPVQVAELVALVTLLIALVPARDDSGPAGLRHFFIARTAVDDPAFAPRPEHAAIVAIEPHVSEPSAKHGLLRGADVVLFSFESVGRDHLAAYAPGGASTPFFDALARRGVTSRHHFCICPTTNDAHIALYAGAHVQRTRAGAVADLRSAGMRTAYLTSARTADYGLRGLLDRSGFGTVVDSAQLGDHATDCDLVTRGVEHLSRAHRDGRPLFLHVHATQTHVPYRVVDPRRFARFDASDDAGRFRNGIEESDDVFARLLDTLQARGLVHNPLVVVTSDHGQAFGAFGYHSHGSAVIADETLVPLALAHPALAHDELETSSHFDVLATVLDLLGVPARYEGYGHSLVSTHRPSIPSLLLSAGHPSRSTASNYGAVIGRQKYMLDLTLDRCHAMDWNDSNAALLHGEEKAYVTRLLARLMARRGVT